jgi:hypothetical protein
MKKQALISNSVAAKSRRGTRLEPKLCFCDARGTKRWDIRSRNEAASRPPEPCDGHSTVLSLRTFFEFVSLATFQLFENPMTRTIANPFQKAKTFPSYTTILKGTATIFV